jgi:phospholipid-binding lipoprotein MlaA
MKYVATKKTVLSLGLFLLSMAMWMGCAAVPDMVEDEIPPKRTVEEYVRDDLTYSIDKYDPWEGMNRRMYKFNAKVDEYVLLPVVHGYEYITPDFVENGISNFFKNLGELPNFTNSFFQFKMGKAGITLSRFTINTTIGVLGLWDPATAMGIRRENEDFGQTLGFYGVGNGPFLVLPLLGPSSLRDFGGFAVDTATISIVQKQVKDELNWSDSQKDLLIYGLALLQAIDIRHNMDFRYHESGSPFEYDMIRLFYLEGRQILVDG